MKNINIIITALLFFGVIEVNAQTQSYSDYKKEKKEVFNSYKKNTTQELNEYRAKINAEFANFMEKKWEAINAQKAQEVPSLPEPTVPYTAPTELEDSTTSHNITPTEITSPKTTPVPNRKPVIDTEETVCVEPVVQKEVFNFNFYGVTCSISVDNSLKFTLPAIDESSVADAWRLLSENQHTSMVNQCIELQNKLKLNDWGYIQLINKFSDNFFGAYKVNESQILQMFLLTQSGFSVRIARTNNRLMLLMPFDATLYSRISFELDQKKYYALDKNINSGEFYIFNHAFPNEKIVSLTISTPPSLSPVNTKTRTLTSKRYPNMSVNVVANKSLIEFYNDYPSNSRWDVYTNTPLSSQAYTTLCLNLAKLINGKTELEAAEMLLNFVQTAFDYKTDGEQFGYERPLFAEESLYYPYNDCEDRSILFSLLVSKLLSLDVVLLNFPGHMATAVAFNSNITRDNIVVNGKQYTVCDPTYIGAKVGETIPEFYNQSVKIITLH